MKEFPKKCTECRFAHNEGHSEIERKCKFTYSVKRCVVTNKEIPYEYSKEKKNWCYIKPDWCPLREDDKTGE